MERWSTAWPSYLISSPQLSVEAQHQKAPLTPRVHSPGEKLATAALNRQDLELNRNNSINSKLNQAKMELRIKTHSNFIKIVCTITIRNLKEASSHPMSDIPIST